MKTGLRNSNGDISNSFLLTIYTIQDTLKECDLDKLANDMSTNRIEDKV